jgi:hypothetical protein
MILYIVLCSSAITLLLTANQLYRDYQTDVGIINAGFEQNKNVHLKSLEATVWATDIDKLQTQIDGISNLPDIEYVSVTEDGKTLASVGEITGKNLVSNSYPLTHLHKVKNLSIGIVKVVANLDSAYFRVLDRAVVIIVSNAIKTLLVAAFMLLIFHLVVTRHLISIAQYISDIRLDNPAKPLQLSRKKGRKKKRTSWISSSIPLMKHPKGFGAALMTSNKPKNFCVKTRKFFVRLWITSPRWCPLRAWKGVIF